MRDAVDKFRDAMRAAGLTPPEVIEADGRLHRFSSSGKRKDDAGFYVLHVDGVPAGMFGDWRTDLKQTWRASMGRALTPAEHTAYRERIAAMKAAREAEEACERAEATKRAGALMDAASAVAADHPYLTRKGVAPVDTLRELPVDDVARIIGYRPKANGEQLTGRVLLAPVTINGKLSTVEMIDEAGRKSALKGGAKRGGYWAACPLPAAGDEVPVLIAEGVSTALSALEATGFPAVAALSAGQLEPAARSIRSRHPAASPVILADVLKDTGEPDPRAVEAARAVGAALAVPDFGPLRVADLTDFNDMMSARGIEAVRGAILAALKCADDQQCAGLPDSRESYVTGVTDVQPSNDADPAVTPPPEADVTDVTDSLIPGPGERPRFVVLDDALPVGHTTYRAGVWFFGVKAGKGEASPTLIEQWIASPLHVDAVTFDGQENNFGRLLRFKNTLGRWRTWAMPMEMLRAAGDEMRGELLAMGVQIDPGGHRLLGQYLQSLTPRRRVRCALSVGWCGADYVLPDEVIGPNASGVIFQSGERGHDEYTRGGTLDGWQQEIAARAVGNPLLMLAISASFTGPLLTRCNAEGGGIHFVGDSSTGKTTAIEAACATWGGPTFRRSWRATANGMEGAAANFNDGLLALDEISEADPREVGAIVYALGNGRGKQRASRSGAARSVTQWRTFVLSSGERTIETTMAEGGHRAKAGQSVRLLDIPASRTFGAWDTLHEFPSGNALSDALKRAAAKHYGHAGRAFLHKLTRDPSDFAEMLNKIMALPMFAAEDGEGQDRRAAGRFALLGLAGELATEYGLTGWEKGAAIEAAAECFRAWRAARGRGNDERRKILDQVAGFIERHGDSRFSDADADADAADKFKVINRAGWWRDDAAGRVYLFNADGMREAVAGFDFKRALDVLQAAEALPRSSGERAKPERVAGRPTPVRLYAIHSAKLRGGDVA
jgi:putative DNA primase/helicase